MPKQLLLVLLSQLPTEPLVLEVREKRGLVRLGVKTSLLIVPAGYCETKLHERVLLGACSILCVALVNRVHDTGKVHITTHNCRICFSTAMLTYCRRMRVSQHLPQDPVQNWPCPRPNFCIAEHSRASRCFDSIEENATEWIQPGNATDNANRKI